MRGRENNNYDLKKWKYKRKTILCSENLWASPDWARPDVQHDGDHLFHHCHQAYYHHITITVITIITIIIVIMKRWSQASALSSIARSISPAWSPPLDGELGGFFDFLGWSFLSGVWLLRVLITREVFITVWCCNCSSLRSLTSYISWSATLSHSTSKHILTTFKHLWRLMYLISSL